MTRPRLIHRNASYRLSSRCVFRQSLLRPGRDLNNAVGYWLGVTSQRYGILVHSFCAMSNHIHLDVTDPEGRVTDFMRDFKGVLARCLNAHWGRWEYLWAPGPSGMQRVLLADDAAAGMAYTAGNPVAAGLVADPSAWPGLITTPRHLEQVASDSAQFTFTRPPQFFRALDEGGTLPDEVTLSLAAHPLGADDPASFIKQVVARVQEIVDKKRAELKAKGDQFAGAGRVLAASCTDVPSTPAPRRERNPRLACKTPMIRCAMLQLEQLMLGRYEAARRRWLAGKTAFFPLGTNQMRDYPGVTVRAGPVAA